MSGKIITRVRQRQAQTLTAQRRRELRAKMEAEQELMQPTNMPAPYGIVIAIAFGAVLVVAFRHLGWP